MGGILSRLGGQGAGGQGMQAPSPVAAMQSGPSQAQLQMALSMLGNAAQSAQGAGSPLLSFLAPMATGFIGNNIQKKLDTAKAQTAAQLSETLLGPQGMSPTAKAAMDVLNNQDAPDYLKSIAQSMLTAATKPARSGGGGSRSSGVASSPRLYGDAFQDGDTWYKLDSRGKRHAVERGTAATITDGLPVSPLAQPGQPAPSLPTPSMPSLPGDPSAPQLQNDPLGIR